MRLLTLHSILVATDLSDTSGPALRAAARLAPLAGASLHVLHVADTPRHDLEVTLLRQFREAAPDAAEPASVRVAFGPPSSVIVEHAVESAADVVILGAHRGENTRTPLGSTAKRVVHSALCPCLVASSELRLPLERVLAPIELSKMAGGALSLALSWASALRVPGRKADLIALHVTQDDGTEAAREFVREKIARARHRVPEAAQVAISERIVFGDDPAQNILHEATTLGADLMVMGTRATDHRVQELGSVSAAVVRATPCPLLLVPPAVWEQGGVLA